MEPHYDTKFTSLTGFGKNILQKYGWKSGDGLGRKRQGITDIVKVIKKSNKSGVSTNNEKNKFKQHWWEKMYDNLLEGTDVAEDKVGFGFEEKETRQRTKLSVASKMIEISEMSKKKKDVDEDGREYVLNGYFVRAKVNLFEAQKSLELKKSNEKVKDSDSDSESESDDEDKPLGTVISNNLFEVCGGRTLKRYRQVGKMKRIAEQDRLLALKMKNKSLEKTDPVENGDLNHVSLVAEKSVSNESECDKKKKKKKVSVERKKKKVKSMEGEEDGSVDVEKSERKKKKKTKKKGEDESGTGKRKKKKKIGEVNEEDENKEKKKKKETLNEEETIETNEKKKKKKSKKEKKEKKTKKRKRDEKEGYTQKKVKKKKE